MNNIPPLRTLVAPDLKHFDSLPNPNNEKRRPARNIFADLRMVCSYIDSHARANGFSTVGKSRDELITFFDGFATVENGLYCANQGAANA